MTILKYNDFMKKKQSIYDFTIEDNKGNLIPLSLFKGKILLIVNSAIHCSFTPCYKELELTYRKYHSQGFEILDFPCNQFHGQAPESDEEINNFCISNYHTTFLRFKKVEVKGENANPLFTYLTKKKKFIGFDPANPLSGVIASIHIKEGPGWEKDNSIKWNFTKFLIDRKGKVVKRFEATAKAKDIDKAIERIIDTQLEEENNV
jgi:glutathione peroxidase